MEDNEKYIIEERKDYTIDKLGMLQGGTWEAIRDEFGTELIFDFYSEAHRVLKAKCPKTDLFGDKIGRVSKVVMINRKRDDKK